MVTLQDRYRLDRKIAAGGMGTVHEATDQRLNRKVAVKVLKDGLSDDPTFVERFRREARAAAALTHPNIANVYDFGGEQGAHFMVMELAPGRDLAQVLRDEGRLEPRRAVHIAAQIAEALAHAHAAGVVHRDIKPANVMVGDDDRVKVTDFGIARAAGDSTLTAAGSVLGTPQYISPEQASGDTVGPPSDIYSLGIVLYEMLTGTPPFTEGNALAIAGRHMTDEVPAPSLAVPDLPPALDEVVRRTCAKQPAERYATADDLASALRGAALEPEPGGGETQVLDTSAATTQTVWPIPGDRYDPNRLGRMVLLAFGALAAIALLLLIWRVAQDDETPASRRERRAGGDRQTTAPPVPGTASITDEVIGEPYEEIQDELEAAGFEVTVEFVPTEDLDEGLIAYTEPPPGTSGIPQTTPITLYVSSGEIAGESEEDKGGPPEHSKGKGKDKDDD